MVLNNYREAILRNDRDGKVEAVIRLLELPSHVLEYSHEHRGRTRNARINERLSKIISKKKQEHKKTSVVTQSCKSQSFYIDFIQRMYILTV